MRWKATPEHRQQMAPPRDAPLEIAVVSAVDADRPAISAMLITTFNQFVCECTQQGRDSFGEFVSEDALRARAQAPQLVAKTDAGEVVGFTEARDNTHICLLFVKKEYQGRGLSRRLLNSLIGVLRERNPSLRGLTVNSSPNAVAIYEHMGFHPTGPMQRVDGLPFTPMYLELGE